MAETEIPNDVWTLADSVWLELSSLGDPMNGFREAETAVVARAILAERERWKPAAIYFERYCQDEADDVENCVCGQQQHEDAKAFASSIRSGAQHE